MSYLYHLLKIGCTLRSPEEMEDGSVNVVYDRLNHVPFAYHVK